MFEEIIQFDGSALERQMRAAIQYHHIITMSATFNTLWLIHFEARSPLI